VVGSYYFTFIKTCRIVCGGPAFFGGRRGRAAKTGRTMKIKANKLGWLLAALLPLGAGCATIHKAADAGDVARVDVFLQKGVDVDARDAYGRTPLMLAVSQPELARHLVARGADVNARDVNGETPLMKAAFIGRLDVVRYLEEQGAELQARDDRGGTVLMLAASDLGLVRYLVEKGADVNARNAQGETALKWAAAFGHLDVVKYLVEHGADVNARDARGQTPLQWADNFGHRSIVRYLKNDAAALDEPAPRKQAAGDRGQLPGAAWLEARNGLD